jgi:Integrase core domain
VSGRSWPSLRTCRPQPRGARPNRKWIADFTYVSTAEGWLYVAAVIDLFSRRVVGWSMNAAMTAQLVTDALVMAIWRVASPTQRCITPIASSTTSALRRSASSRPRGTLRCVVSMPFSIFPKCAEVKFPGWRVVTSRSSTSFLNIVLRVFEAMLALPEVFKELRSARSQYPWFDD